MPARGRTRRLAPETTLVEWLLAHTAIRHAAGCTTYQVLTPNTRCTCGLAAAWESHRQGVGA